MIKVALKLESIASNTADQNCCLLEKLPVECERLNYQLIEAIKSMRYSSYLSVFVRFAEGNAMPKKSLGDQSPWTDSSHDSGFSSWW